MKVGAKSAGKFHFPESGKPVPNARKSFVNQFRSEYTFPGPARTHRPSPAFPGNLIGN